MAKKSYTGTNPKKLQEVGVSGFVYYSGKVQNDIIKILRGKNKFKYFRDMVLNDAYIGANHKLVTSLASKSTWQVKPASNSKKDQKIAEFVSDCLFNDLNKPFSNVIKYVSSGLFIYGFALNEIVYKKRPDGKYGLYKLAPRSQTSIDRWEFDRNFGEVTGIVQKDPVNYREIRIPMEKLLHFRMEDGNDSPEGTSLLRNCVFPYHIKTNISDLESIRVENDCRGIKKYTAPLQYLVKTDNEVVKSFQDMINTQMQNISNGRNSSITVPGNQGFDFDIINTSGSIVNDTNIIIERCNRDIAISLLSDFVLLGHKSSASGNIGSTKVKVFTSFVGSLMDDIRHVFNKQLIPRLLEINNIKVDKMPELIHTNLQELQAMEAAVFLQSVGKSSAYVPTKERDNALAKLFFGSGFPEVSDEEWEEWQKNHDNNTVNDGEPPPEPNKKKDDEGQE